MLDLLQELFQRVHSYMKAANFDRKRVYRHYAGHDTLQFDYEAEEIILQGLQASGIGFEIVSEERPVFSTVAHPQYRVIVDPVDGSTNVERGIPCAGLTLAVLQVDVPVLPENVAWALVGELYSGSVYSAIRGQGATWNGQPCQVSQTRQLQQCLAGLNVDGRDQATTRKLLTEQPVIGSIRRSGSSGWDSVQVASGAYDAYIDVGEKLTGESFLAAASIVLAAGGIVSDHLGQPLKPITNLTDGYSILLAATPELHAEIVGKIKM